MSLAEHAANLIPVSLANSNNQIIDITLRPRPKDDQVPPVKIEKTENQGLVIHCSNKNYDITIRQRPECLHVDAFPIKREKGVKPRLVIHCPGCKITEPASITNRIYGRCKKCQFPSSNPSMYLYHLKMCKEKNKKSEEKEEEEDDMEGSEKESDEKKKNEDGGLE